MILNKGYVNDLINMKTVKIIFSFCIILLLIHPVVAQIRTGADQTSEYLGYLKGKRIGMVVYPTSRIGDKSSVDSLIALGVNIVKVFGPEHGFRGDVGAGVKVTDAVDPATGVKIVSLYERPINRQKRCWKMSI